MPSKVTARAQAFVAEHTAEAQGLGQSLAELIDEPDEFVAVLREGLASLADPAYAAEQERVANALEDDAEVMSNTKLEELLVGQPQEVQDEIIRINTDARPLALQIALLIPLLAG